MLSSYFCGLLIAFVVIQACGTNHDGHLNPVQAPFTVQNPNFEEGLIGWQTSGNVTLVDVKGDGGFSKAAMLVYDGTTPATLSQNITVPYATSLGVSAYEAPPAQGMLKIAYVQNGNSNGYVSIGGNPNWTQDGIIGKVSAGTVTVIWTMDGTALPSIDGNMTQVPAETFTKVTGVVIDPNAPQPGPT